MPRKYVVVSSSSSSVTSLHSRCSSLCSGSDSESALEQRRRRERRRRHDRSSRGLEEPSESLHWWLARWLSSEFAKLALSVYEGGKGCIRYLSSTALRALPSARTARELLAGSSTSRRSRRRRERRRSPRPGGSAESLRVGKSRKSHRASRHGRKERPLSPKEGYVKLKHQHRSKYGHTSPPPAMKQRSSQSHHCNPLTDSWIYEENWIENLLKEVKSNFKNPVKVKVYKVTPSEGPRRSSRSDNSQTDSKISISIEELISPTYPSRDSDVISTSSGRGRSERTSPPAETRVPKTKCEKRAGSDKPRCGRSASPVPGLKNHLEKLPTPKAHHRTSVSRLSPADLSVVGDGGFTSRTDRENRSRHFANSRDGAVFYPKPGLRCRVVCEDAPTSSISDLGGSERIVSTQKVPKEPIREEPVSIDGENDGGQRRLAFSYDVNEPCLTEGSDIVTDEEQGLTGDGVPRTEDSIVEAKDTLTLTSRDGGKVREKIELSEGTAAPGCSSVCENSVPDSSEKSPSFVQDLSPEVQSAPAPNDVGQCSENVVRSHENSLELVKSRRESRVSGRQESGFSNREVNAERERNKKQCYEEKEATSLQVKSVSNENLRPPSLLTPFQAPATYMLNNEQQSAYIKEVSRNEVISRSITITSSSPSAVQVPANDPMKTPQPKHVPGGGSSVSTKTADDDPAMLFRMTVHQAEDVEAAGVGVSGVSMLASSTVAASGPFVPSLGGSASNQKAVSNHQEQPSVELSGPEQVGTKAPASPAEATLTSSSLLQVKGSKDSSSSTKVAIAGSTSGGSELSGPEQVGSVTKAILSPAKATLTSSALHQVRGSKDSLSSTKVVIASSTSGGSISAPSKGILKESSSSRSKLFLGRSKSSSRPQLPADYETVHPELVRSSSKEVMDVIWDRPLSSPSLKGTSKDSLPKSSEAGLIPADINNFSIVNEPSDKIIVLVSETSDPPLYPTSKTTVQSARSIVESVTNSGTPSDTSTKRVSQRTQDSPVSTTSQVPEEVVSSGSQKDLAPIVDIYSRSNTSGISTGTVGNVSEGSQGTLHHDSQEGDSHVSVHSKLDESLHPVETSVPMVVTTSVMAVSSHAGEASKTDSSTEQGSPQPSTRAGDENESSPTDLGALAPTLSPPEASRPADQPAKSTSDVTLDDSNANVTAEHNESAVSITQVSKGDSKDGPELHLTFGEVEQMSYLEAVSIRSTRPSVERFKMLERTSSSSKSTLPPIKEEVEGEGVVRDRSPSPSIIQQRRQSKVTPGLLKRKSRPSTFSSALSTASTYTDDVSDGSASEFSHCASAFDRCPCKKICDCCTCGRRGSEKPSLALSRSVSKDHPPAIESQVKSTSKHRPSRIANVDMTSTPVPKNSFDVLRSPFYAHWDYYDLDQDHPIARYVRRPDQAEFDNTDTILVKNVRVGGYTIPYLKLQTKEKVTSKMVCNFYKTRKLPHLEKGNSKANLMDPKGSVAERSCDSAKCKEEAEEKRKCQCKSVKPKKQDDEENIWKDYVREDGGELLEFPTDMMFEQSSCSRAAEEGCTCVDQPERARTVPMPSTPCVSCDCFISDVELESAPPPGAAGSAMTDLSDSVESLAERNAIVNEYICGLQELCANLCSMIGKMRLVIDETSNSGSTFRSPRRSTLQRPSIERSSKSPGREEGTK